MRTPKHYPPLPTRYYRSEVSHCPTCQTFLRRATLLSRRTIITLTGPVRIAHWGSRCPNPVCPTRSHTYRNRAADALALPGFTFGLDIVRLVGHLRLVQHQTVDEIHQTLLSRLAPWNLTISRREILSLFDAYCVLLRAAHEQREGSEWEAWVAQVQANGGLILSIDGIQPDKGNETIYLVREVLTGRILAAENVSASRADVIKDLLAPVLALGLPVLGLVSDAQESLLLAAAALCPKVPHQVCQFHYLREASRPMFEADRHLKMQLRKPLQSRLPVLRDQLIKDRQAPDMQAPQEQHHLALLNDYLLAVQTTLTFEGTAPFAHAGLATFAALEAIAASLQALQKKRRASTGKWPFAWTG
jgi:hypothetical protein